MGPRFVSFAAVFYGLLVVAAAVWCGLRGFALPVFGPRPALGLLLGLFTAATTVALSLAAYRLVPLLRRLADELAPSLVDGAGRGGLVLVAIFSGVGEETFFRGAFYHYLRRGMGVVVTVVLTAFFFAAVHPQGIVGIPAIASIGMVLALIREWRGSILASMTAHACNNLVVLTIGILFFA